jgi:hypothetical protein
MKIVRSWGLCLFVVAAIAGVVQATSVNSIRTPLLDDDGHRSSLPIRITMLNGIERTVTLEGVGCPVSMCSRVRVRNTRANNVWLDGVASVSGIQNGASGTVKAIFNFKSGEQGQESVVSGNRVLYVKDGRGRREKLDLADVRRISFLQ